ncbi:seven-hairpin glycosidase [Dentipellis sp. KUC8613]|nr:seven-hairpin glycosidase [Dentipellis sp. KUC8613]
MRHTFAAALLLSPLALGANIQKPGIKLPANAAANRQAVVDIFTDSYQTYRTLAFGHDEVNPVSRTVQDPRNGWGASIVDGLSTMVSCAFDFFNEGVNFSQSINFNQSNTPDTVSVFESTIRYVGGLISAYELSGKQHFFLVEKAKQLADKLAFAWVGNNTVPFGFVDFSDNTPTFQTSNIAEAGTLTLEWSRLSEYTGDDKYRKLTEGSVKDIAAQPDPLPGLAGQGIDPTSGTITDPYVTWGGGSDSYFEYLIKYARLSNTPDNTFANTWRTAVDSSIKTLLKTSTVGNHLYLADFDESRTIRHVGSHLACFYAGNWLMGGRLTNNQTIVDIALELNDACWNTYAGDATGIGPEAFAYISSDGNFTGNGNPSADQLAFYQKNGYYITSSDYIQRPEVLESNFYAWRVTGDSKYVDRAASAVASFQKFLKVSTGGYSGINDVNNLTSGEIDETESFWFAEVLKYLFLTFDDPNTISLDSFVFNTEGHPFIAPPAKATYGTGINPATKAPPPPTTTRGPRPAVSPDAQLGPIKSAS